MRVKISVLGSGSSGNAVFISGGSHSILIDAGLSGKETEKRMNQVGVSCEDLNALLVTHEHSDHTKGIGILSRRYQLPVYANEPTWNACCSKLGKIKEEDCCIFRKEFMIGDLGITPFSIPHDASAPVGYIVEYKGIKVGVATDMGYIKPEVEEILKGLDFIVLESNHDLEMLMNGSYPWYLKKRINGENGHLSNDDAADLIPRLVNGNYPRILLAHLSKDNNMPDLAYITAKNSLESSGLKIGEDLELDFAYRDRPTKLFKIG